MKSFFVNIISTSLFLLLSLSTSSVCAKIVGGTEAEKGRYSYMVALLTFNGDRYCGGSLISPNYVLTAAQCAGIGTQVIIGRHDEKEPDDGSYEIIEIEYEVKHSDSSFDTLENDIMVLKLKENSTYTPVAYDTGSENITSGMNLNLMGFGTTESGIPSFVLTETELNFQSNEECEIESSSPYSITDDMMCASADGEEKGACAGDGGGPLIIKGNDAESDVLVGIISWGANECGDPDFSDVFSRVSVNSDFVDCVLAGGSEECGIVCTEKRYGLIIFYTLFMTFIAPILESFA